MSHTLRFPIHLAPGRELDGLAENSPEDLDGLSFSFKKEKPLLTVLVSGFRGESEALEYIPRLRGALYWAAVEHGLAFKAELSPDRVVATNDPVKAAENIAKQYGLKNDKVHGMVNGNYPSVYRTEDTVLTVTAGTPSFVIGVPFPQFLRSLRMGFSEVSASALESDRLCTALALFCARYYENTNNARLLALVMVMEVLAPKVRKHPVALAMLKQWHSDTQSRMAQIEQEDEKESLEALERELLFRRDASIRSCVRALVRSVPHLSESDAKRTVAIYDLRSTLVHEGGVSAEDMANAIKDAEEIVCEILRDHLRGNRNERNS